MSRAYVGAWMALVLALFPHEEQRHGADTWAHLHLHRYTNGE